MKLYTYVVASTLALLPIHLIIIVLSHVANQLLGEQPNVGTDNGIDS